MVDHGQPRFNHGQPEHFYPTMVDPEHDGDLSLLTCVYCSWWAWLNTAP